MKGIPAGLYQPPRSYLPFRLDDRYGRELVFSPCGSMALKQSFTL